MVCDDFSSIPDSLSSIWRINSPCLEAVSSIHSSKTRRTVIAED